ncbi:helix-turn-helix transcriptional regulator [Mycobacterium sp. IS-1742]|uniref:helix-turn-helix transcriptional regulator n=1 Tax=Mycobacterium sp. IS-1742 TaxID=1772285 RepID=UPI000B32BECF|nr:helix-turn-helix transcriptional regulator [Mycobacterium sp. IS-1742]
MKPIAPQFDSLVVPSRTRREFTDPDKAAAFLDDAYGSRLRLSRLDDPAGGAVLTHTRHDAGAFVIDDFEVAGRFTASPEPLHKVAAVWANRGRIAGRCAGVHGRARTGEIALLTQPDLPHDAEAEDIAVTTVLLDPALVAGVATGVPQAQAQPIRFSLFEPVDDPAARLWQRTVRYVKDGVLADDALATPLVLGHAARLLAAVTVAAFPATAGMESTAHDRDAKPVLLRRATDFIEENLGNDIALADIAAAIHVSPRAVQYMFRRHLETTPVQYLRRLRLHHAHQDLIAGDHGHDTVTAIAARWGFAHTGRFAVLYRQTYGQSPHTTLRGHVAAPPAG